MDTNLNNTDIQWEKIAAFLSGNMSEPEQNEFRRWLNSNPANSQLFNQARKDWTMTGQNPPKRKFNIDNAWDKLSTRINEEDKIIPMETADRRTENRKVIPLWLKAAAVLLIGLLAGYGTYSILEKPETTSTVVAQNGNALKNIQLADATQVYLNRQSKLEYPKQFGSSARNVKLDGEAFFDVKRDEKKPFVIETAKAEITVLGTSFNVNTRLTKGRTEVTVKTGKVKVQSTSGESVIIVAGEKCIISENTLIKETIENDNYIAWRTNKIICRGQSLAEFINTINSVYNIQVEAGNAEVEKLVMGNTVFDNYSADTVLNILCSAFNLKMEHHQNKIILYRQ